jgi:hypothetical protein
MSHDAYERWNHTLIEGDPFVSVVIPAHNQEVQTLVVVKGVPQQ